MSKRKEKEKQVWADISFRDDLTKIQGRMMLMGKGRVGQGDITRRMRECPSYQRLMEEILSNRPKIRIDRKRIS